MSALALAVVLTLVSGASRAADAPSVLELNSELRVAVRLGRAVELQSRATESSSFASIAERLTGSADRAGTLEAHNSPVEVRPGRWIGVPLGALTPEFRGLVLRNLFPGDRRDGDDWIHIAGSGTVPMYDEGLWQVAEWFTGSGEQFPGLMKANGLSSPELRRGQAIRIPAELLHRSFQSRLSTAGGDLEFGLDDSGPFAGYRLKSGEAIYSAVVLRFTGRTASADVQSVASQLLARSRLPDPSDIPSGFEVKIPLDLLEPQFLPEGHPRRRVADEERAALEREMAVARSGGGLRDVVVIIDPGHGGRDLGTVKNDIWEHDYVYDVACRLKEMLEQGSAAQVVMTLEDQETGCRPSTSDKLIANRQGTVLTTPPFLAREGESAIGVNLRWYLSNSVYRASLKKGVKSDRVVFLSLHADSRHPGLRGLMVYVAGAGYNSQAKSHSSATYRKYKEVREETAPTLSKQKRVRSEAISRRLANDVVKAFKAQGLPVQPYQPVRNRIIRGKNDKWVPAVLRNNAVPTKVLIEMLNLSNRDDAKLLGSSRRREQMAEAILDSLYAHFGEKPGALSASADD